jgi:hypothetical protein
VSESRFEKPDASHRENDWGLVKQNKRLRLGVVGEGFFVV